MSTESAVATGADLSSALSSALSDLLDDEVSITAPLPGGVEVRDVRVEVTADVRWDDQGDGDVGEAAAGPDEELDDELDDDDDLVLSEEELDELDEEAEAGADFVEGLLDAMDLPGELRIRVLEDTRRAEVEVVNMDSGALIGRRGSTLEAIQELMRCALQSQFERRVHVHVDVEGYRARRLEKLLDKADEAIDHVLDTGEPERLEPMDVFERKTIHEFVNTVDGVASRSQGREPSRRVVIEPTG